MNRIDNYLSINYNKFNYIHNMSRIKSFKHKPIILNIKINLKNYYKIGYIQYIHHDDPLHSQK